MCHIFLESLGNIQFNEDDPTHHDHHQQGHDDQEYPPSTDSFLLLFFQLRPMYHIFFENIRQNLVR